MTRKLWDALNELEKMKVPSVSKILRKRGFGVEADVIQEVIDSFDDYKAKVGEPELIEEGVGEETEDA